MNNSSFRNCSFVTADITFLFLSLFLFLISSLAILVNAFMIFVLLHSRSLHSNVRLLLQNFCLASSILSFSLLIRSVYHFYIWDNGFVSMAPFDCALAE